MSEPVDLFPDLPGTVDLTVGATMRGDPVVRLEHTITPSVRVAALVPVTDQIMLDGAALRWTLETQADRVFRPWKYPQVTPWPTVDLFPRVSSAGRRVATARAGIREVRRRVAAAVDVLRHGPTHEVDW